MAITLSTVALDATQKSIVSGYTNSGQRIAGLISAVVANTNATFVEAKSFVDALEVEQIAQNGKITSLETLITSSDTALDTLQEIVDFVKLNRTDLDALTITSIAGLRAELDVIITSVTNASAGEETRATGEEARIEEKVDLEISNRVSAVGAEKTRAEGIEGGINSRLTGIENGTVVLSSSNLGSNADWGLV
jgi:hypothetical protein